MVVLAVVVILGILTQTSFFKSRLRTILASSISTNINGTVHLGTIGGDFLNGFSIDSLVIDDRWGTVLTINKISCRYDLFKLLEKKIKIQSLKIEKPVIKLYRPSGGEWNISSLIKGSSDSSAAPFSWTIQIDSLMIEGSTITLLDSASLSSPDHWNLPAEYFEYHSFTVSDLNVDLNAVIKSDYYEARIRRLSCFTPESNFRLKSLRGRFIAGEKILRAEDVAVETGLSNFGFTAELRNVNLFKPVNFEDFGDKETSLDFVAGEVSLAELRSFLPQVNFLSGDASMELRSSGTFGHLRLEQVHLKTMQSAIDMTGLIENLHRPSELYLKVDSKKSTVNPPDVTALLPGLPLPEFGEIGKFTMKLSFDGKPTNFISSVHLENSLNQVKVDGRLNLDTHPPEYSFDYQIGNIDLGKLFRLENFSSSINSHGKINGSGFRVEDLAASLNAIVDSSRLREIPIDRAELSLIGSTRNIGGQVKLFSGNSQASLKGNIDFPKNAPVECDGKIEVSSFDLSKIFRNDDYSSELNFQGTFSAKGFDPGGMNCDFALSLLPSVFRNHELQSDEIYFSLDQSDTLRRKMVIKSQIGDANIDGNFNILESSSDIVGSLTSLIEEIEKHPSTGPDSSGRPSLPKGPSARRYIPPLDFSYNIELKNLEPVASLLSETPFDARGKMQGSVSRHNRLTSISAECDFEEFFVGTAKGGVLLHKTQLSASIDSLGYSDILENVKARLNISVDSGRVNTKKIAATRLSFDHKNLRSVIAAQTTLDSIYSCRLQGVVAVQPRTYAIDFDSLILGYGSYRWRNYQDVQVRLNPEGIRLMHAEFLGDNEQIKLSGSIEKGDTISLSASVENFDLASIGIFSTDPSLRRPGKGFTGRLKSDIKVTGELGSPLIWANLTATDISYRRSPFGTLSAALEYADETAKVEMTMRKDPASQSPDLRLGGTLPCNLAFKSVAERFPARTQNLKLSASKFDLALLDPLLPEFDELGGKLECDLTLAGTPQEPEYKGALSIHDTKFLFRPNNLRYELNGELEAVDDRIKIKNFSLSNLKEKGFIGTANATGYFTLKNFKIDYFDCTATGDFLLMTDATKKISPNMYGLLITQADASGINLRGTLQRPYLTGRLFIREANLTFPPTKDQEAVNQNLTLRYQLIDDTTKISQVPVTVSRYFSQTDTADGLLRLSTDSPLLDRLRYNLNVETRGPTALTMIFTPATGEELYAELDGKASVINEQGTPNVYGEIDVSPRSYYNFFKRFDAKGKLKFVGQWDNPELDIQATYEGYKQESGTATADQKTPETTPAAAAAQPTEQKVIVRLDISGTRKEPKLSMSMKIQKKPGEEPVDFASQAKGGDVQSNALAFIITGKFRDELTSRDQQEFTSLGSATGSSVASNLLSSILSEVLKREFPFIRRADVSYRGGSVQEGTSINVTATVGKGSLRLGGTILQDIGNTSVSYQLNVGDLFDISSIRNLFIEIQRKVEGDISEDKKLTNEARVFYRFSF